MKYIVKTTEPISLTTYRISTPNPNFNSCDKDAIRLSLIKEQGAICAYCMQRISDRWDSKLKKFKTEIEHYKSQDTYDGTNGLPDLRLNYTNMLGVCNGNAGNPVHKQHCDKSKDFLKNKDYLPLTIDPLNKNCERLIEYTASGKISSKNPTINHDLNVVLNLNEENLVKNRKKAIDFAVQSIISSISKHKKDKSWTKSIILQEKKKWEFLNNSAYTPFCQAVINYLDKRLNRI